MSIALGAGAVSVLVAQSLAAAQDRKITPDEQRLITMVMSIVRMAILLLFITQAWYTAIVYTVVGTGLVGVTYPSVHVLSWMLLGILFISFVFIDYKIISRETGVGVQLATWYSLVFAWAWPAGNPIQVDAFMLSYIFLTISSIFLLQRAHQWVKNTHVLHRKSKT